MGLGNINHDEFDTMFELVITMVFMAFGIFAMVSMVKNLSARVEINNAPDKIEVSYGEHVAEDPFYFTGYQAYMFAWHMDESSYESLSYVGGKVIPSEAYLDNSLSSDSQPKVTLSVTDTDGAVIPQFISWRNQMITGSGLGKDDSVKETINSVAPSKATIDNIYKGDCVISGQQILWHLELTDDYLSTNDLGNSKLYGGKTFRWVLAPTYH